MFKSMSTRFLNRKSLKVTSIRTTDIRVCSMSAIQTTLHPKVTIFKSCFIYWQELLVKTCVVTGRQLLLFKNKKNAYLCSTICTDNFIICI